MDPNTIVNLRLCNQKIVINEHSSAKEIVNWMGAFQAQDFYMVKWAIGLRLTDSTEKDIEKALSNGEILRTHLLRPTWHIVSADDIHWLLDLTAPRLKSTMKTRDKELELTEKIYQKCNAVFEKKLEGGNHLSREELIEELSKERIKTDNNRASHILMRAELDGVICSGLIKNKKQTYALLHERVPVKKTFEKDEALALLASKYFRSHGPATLEDFTWWSGLTISDARKALELARKNLCSSQLNNQTYWFYDNTKISNDIQNTICLLPAFDEYLISYKDRTAVLPAANHQKAVSNNGIFWPIIVINGKVEGTWRRIIKKDKVNIEPNFFNTPQKNLANRLNEAMYDYAKFVEMKMEQS